MAKRKMVDRAAQAIKRTWGDVTVTDAKENLRVFIRPSDVKKAKRKDPARCAFANACKRTFGSSKVLFFRRVAYVELKDQKGKRHVERFILSDGMRELIESFDQGKPIIPDAGFLLKRPCPAKTLEAERKYQRERQFRKRMAKLVGKLDEKTPPPRKPKPLLKDFEVRSGTGSVHFVKKPARAK